MFPILNPPPSSLPIPSLWVVPGLISLQSKGLSRVFSSTTIQNFQFFSSQSSLWSNSGSEVKASACNVGDLGSIPGSGRSLGVGNGNPLQYPCLDNPIDGEAWQATVHDVAESCWTERLRVRARAHKHTLPLRATIARG